jgi:hypothetical protein
MLLPERCSEAVTAALRAAAGALPSLAAAVAEPAEPAAPAPVPLNQPLSPNDLLRTQSYHAAASLARSSARNGFNQMSLLLRHSSPETGAEAATRGTLPKKSVTRTSLGCCG